MTAAITYADEAIGMVRAAQAAGLPIAISFTVETDGRLPSGQSLKAAIEQVDAETDGAPVHYMINCAHPNPFDALAEARAKARAHPRPARERIHAQPRRARRGGGSLDDGDSR